MTVKPVDLCVAGRRGATRLAPGPPTRAVTVCSVASGRGTGEEESGEAVEATDAPELLMAHGSTAPAARRSTRVPFVGARPGRAGGRDRRVPDAVVPVATGLLGLVHALVVAPLYHVGSFDDDGSYVLIARALARGTGLGGTLPAGYPLIGTYPPGFPLLLTPLALVSGVSTWPYRVLVLVFSLALFPLTDRWLRRGGSPRWTRWCVLVLLALNPVAASYATEVMAEAPFLVATVSLVLLARRWQAAGTRVLSPWGAGTVLLAAALLWLKEAGLGLVAGLVLWLLLRRAWRQAVTLVVGTGLACAPILLYRAAAGTPLAGSRYSSEIGGGMHLGAIPDAIGQYWTTALPRTLVPLGGLPTGVFAVVTSTVPVFVVVGAVVWAHRVRDPGWLMVAVYLAETLVYPFVNERRVILVLPVVLAWYVVGAHAALRLVGRLLARLRPGLAADRLLAVLLAVLVVVPLSLQLHRYYLLDAGQETSQPLGSPYLRFVRAATDPGEVVETYYQWTTSLGTDRRTASQAFDVGCTDAAIRGAAYEDGARVLVNAAWKVAPPLTDCVTARLSAASWALPLYRTALDEATVYQLVGPGTRDPDARDAVQGVGTESPAAGGTTSTWSWGGTRDLDQLSVGAAAPRTGQASRVRLEWRDDGGRWHEASATDGAVGPTRATPFLLWRPATPVLATGVRVVVLGGEGISTVDVHALTGLTR